MTRLLLFLLAMSVACTPAADPQAPPPNQSEQVAPVSPTPPPAEEPLAERAVLLGMVRPTKGGYEVGDTIVDGDILIKALAGAPGHDPNESDWFLGAVVRIEGEVRKHEAVPPKADGPVEQMRAGSWIEATRIDSATIVKPAEIIEGTLQPSKGFFSLAGRLISRDDLAWSLAPNGGKAGDRVRLYGQPRRVACEPNAQCLVEGSLPLFDVGRAERLP